MLILCENLNGFNLLEVSCMSSSLKVLLVEDMKIARLAVKSSMASLNWQVDTADNGQEAINSCANSDYDLVLMDLGLPDITGIEATKIIKKTNPDLPVVALTAHFDDQNKEAAFAAGMCGFIKKPLTLEKATELYSLLSK